MKSIPCSSRCEGSVRILAVLLVMVVMVVGVFLSGVLDRQVEPERSDADRSSEISGEDNAPSEPADDEDTDAPTEPATRTLVPVSFPTPPTPQWIWGTEEPGENETVWLRHREASLAEGTRVVLRCTADNHSVVRAQGEEVARSDDWQSVTTVELPLDTSQDEGQPSLDLVIEAKNDGGPGGLIAVLEITSPDGDTRYVVSDASWEASDDDSFAEPRPADILAEHGSGDWGSVPGLLGTDLDRSIRVAEGYAVELVHTVTKDQGSWVSLTVDGDGRLIAGDQYGGLFRITPSPLGSPASETVVEPIETEVGGAQGLLALGDDLYVVTNGDFAEGSGLYRLRDTDGDDRYDEWKLLRALEGNQSEHGNHALVEGPDGMLYIVVGNHIDPPSPEKSTVPRVWDEDHLLPRLWDPRGHAVGKQAPGGWIARMDRDGETWELYSTGYRNPYDLAFNRSGDLFTYDADMEWDMGSPWYRPTRVNHVTSGSEFGWRSGSGKWPTYYPDSLPAVLDIGPGSPTGIAFGYGAAFPARDRDALFLLDWTFGTLYAVHLEPDGATYRATHEPFLTGQPLPLTDVAIRPQDGAMYFALGGRRVASALYRVRYVGDEATNDRGEPTAPTEESLVRRELEAFHRPDAPPAAIALAWEHLEHGDRFVRYAARVVLEHQPVERWIDRLSDTRSVPRKLALALALARVGGKEHHDALVDFLLSMPYESLGIEEQIELMRCWALTSIRTGKPRPGICRELSGRIEDVYPTGDDRLDRELCDMLVHLGSPRVVAQTISLLERADPSALELVDDDLLSRSDRYGADILQMATAPPQLQQVHYALALRNAEVGWTRDLRERYFLWFEQAKSARGGRSYTGFLDAIRKDALERIPEKERARYENLGATPPPGFDAAVLPRGPGRAWTVDEIERLAKDGMTHRNFERGKELYAGALCYHCHRLAGEGSAGGPDLTALATRFSLRDILESTLWPSRTISDQYTQDEIVLVDDTVHVGRVVGKDDTSITILPSLLEPDVTIQIPTDRIRERRVSTASPMMPNLLTRMAPGEVLDLLAYLLSSGDPSAPAFAPAGAAAFEPLFDGATLDGWKSDVDAWSIEDGVLVGRTTEGSDAAEAGSYLVLDRELPDDFELRFDVKLDGENNSGVQYRSRTTKKGLMAGYQIDIHPKTQYQGALYETRGRKVLAEQGRRIAIDAAGESRDLEGATPPPLDFGTDRWRTYTVLARGNRIEHRIDGTVTCIVEDDGSSDRTRGRTLALQLHRGEPYEVRFRNLVVRPLP